ncbi:AAA family ATPase [Accumulibacter sp.]|uniref:AAA family ATPase n=1 Tax=Accumulibacter sp. TaxID=2053492 RepID=UPI00338E5D4C
MLRQNRKPKLNISWDKDRGKDVESAPWFSVFKGERINDHHLTLAEKRAAQSLKGRFLMLKRLSLKNIGPAQAMDLEFGDRLNLITGDNGLGKSFLLDIAWWAMTRKWPAEINPA